MSAERLPHSMAAAASPHSVEEEGFEVVEAFHRSVAEGFMVGVDHYTAVAAAEDFMVVEVADVGDPEGCR